MKNFATVGTSVFFSCNPQLRIFLIFKKFLENIYIEICTIFNIKIKEITTVFICLYIVVLIDIFSFVLTYKIYKFKKTVKLNIFLKYNYMYIIY